MENTNKEYNLLKIDAYLKVEQYNFAKAVDQDYADSCLNKWMEYYQNQNQCDIFKNTILYPFDLSLLERLCDNFSDENIENISSEFSIPVDVIKFKCKEFVDNSYAKLLKEDVLLSINAKNASDGYMKKFATNANNETENQK